jgi:4'-phosphopantetheinyl transferase
LPEDEVHLWYFATDELTDSAWLAECERVLSAEEKERWQRFRFEEGRQQFLLSHGFLRFVLSHYAAVAPEAWAFTRSARGKPEIVPPDECPELRSLCFNLTHTAGLAACVVAWNREVGVDAEDVTRRGRPVSEELIRYCLSPAELSCFETLPADQRQDAFFDYWTLKEAYLKARGFGLALPIQEITFTWPSGVPHEGRAAVMFGPVITDDPHTWQLERFRPTTWHKIAVAIRRLAGPDLTMIVREFSSSVGQQ